MARHKGRLKSQYRCEVCSLNIPDHASHKERHDKGDRHKRLEELFYKKDLLKSWNVEFLEKEKCYICVTCGEVLELSFQKIQLHYKTQHFCCSGIDSTANVKQVFKKFKKKKYYEDEYDFEDDKKNFSTIEGSTELRESVNIVGILTLNVIAKSKIRRLYQMASFLEMRGKACSRGKKKQATKMVMFGLYENHQCGW